jgi:hypothetical protein
MEPQELKKPGRSRLLMLVVATSIIALGLYGGFQDQIPSGWPKGLVAGVVFGYLACALWLIAKRNKS